MKYSRYLILLLLTAFILSTRYNTNIAEWYAVSLYPTISAVLSFIACWIPFSMEEIFVLGAILLSCIIFARGIRKKERWYKVALYEIELVAWIVVWFYIGWGMNYFRQNIYERASVEKQKFNEEVFNHFLSDICRNSQIPQVRYSAYFSLLPHVLTNLSIDLSIGSNISIESSRSN